MNEFEVVYLADEDRWTIITRPPLQNYWTVYLKNAETEERAHDIVEALREGERRNND